MMARIGERGGLALAILGRLLHALPNEHETTIGTRGAQSDPSSRGPSLLTPRTPLEAPAWASGVVRHEEVPLLSRYGTSYGLFDEWICDYACVLVSDTYRLGEYVGDSVWVSGPLREVIGGMPVMKVTRLELRRLKWMH